MCKETIHPKNLKPRKCHNKGKYDGYCHRHRKLFSTDVGICQFCHEPCNPCSQSCGICARKLTMGLIYGVRGNVYDIIQGYDLIYHP